MSSIYTVTRPPAVPGIEEIVRGGVDSSGAGHPPHWHSTWQLVAVTRGDGWVRTRGTQHQTPAGSMFLIPPEVVHSNNVFAEGCDFRSMLIDARTVEEIAETSEMRVDRTKVSRAPVLCSERLTRRFDAFHQQLESPVPESALEHDLGEWIASILARQTGQGIETGPRTIIHPAAKRARDFVAAHAAEKFSLEALSRDAGLSRFELIRQFKAAYGMPPHAWQLQIRIDRSKDLLKRGHSAGETALELGFSDQAHFSRIFKRTTGYTPARFGAEFRKNIQERPRSLEQTAG